MPEGREFPAIVLVLPVLFETLMQWAEGGREGVGLVRFRIVTGLDICMRARSVSRPVPLLLQKILHC